MAVTVVFDVVQQIVVKATITEGPASGYCDAITFTAPTDFPAATQAQMLTALGLTAAQIRQQFNDRFQQWKANQALARVPPSSVDLLSMADLAVANQDSALNQLDAATRQTYLQALQVRIATKLAQG